MSMSGGAEGLGYDPKELARSVNNGGADDAPATPTYPVPDAKEISHRIATGRPTVTTPSEPFATAPYDAHQLAISNAFDSVYGDGGLGGGGGFVKTDDADGGFFDWVQQKIDPEALRKRERANKTRMGILALGDAIRQFGNIYHTTKGAPSQKFNDPVGTEYARIKTEQEKYLSQLATEYKGHLSQLEKAAQLAEKQRQFDQAQAFRAQQQQATEDYRKESMALRREMAENQKAMNEARLAETKRAHDNQYSLGRARIATSGSRRGSGGSGRWRVSGGSGGRRGSGKVSVSVDVPNTITTASGKRYNMTGQGTKEKYVNRIYDDLEKAGLVRSTTSNTGLQKKLENLYEAAENDARVRKRLEAYGISVSGGNGSYGYGKGSGQSSQSNRSNRSTQSNQRQGGAATGGGKPSGAASGGGKPGGATQGRSQAKPAQPSKPASNKPSNAATSWRDSAVTDAKLMYVDGGGRNNRTGQSGRSTQSGQSSPRQAGGATGRANSGTSGGRQGAVRQSGGRTDRFPDGRARQSRDHYGSGGSAGKSLNIPTELKSPSKGTYSRRGTGDTLKYLYNEFVKRGWVGGGARNANEMVDAIYDNLDNESLTRTLDLLDVRYNPDWYWDDPDNFE